MSTNRILLVGLEEQESQELKTRIQHPIVSHPKLPLVKLEDGQLWVEHPVLDKTYLPIHQVIFHGIFEDDFDFIITLALWRGPCLPNAMGLLDARLRFPCLARALKITKFGSMLRSFLPQTQESHRTQESVAKWGNWHCGENKEKFIGSFPCSVPTLIEPFIQGEAVRVTVIGNQAWQIRLAGENWLKSIHHQNASFMPLDPELVEDTKNLADHFGLEIMATDYMVGTDGSKHLLEVNHVPNVTVFPEIRQAFLDFAIQWVES